MGKLKKHARLLTQIGAAVLQNGNIRGFITGTIYTGKLKSVCVPGLNCYSCPGALGSCPVGSLQAVAGSRSFNLSFYVIGLIVLMGACLGRWICGFLCPFGLVQDLIYRIPFVKKLKVLPGDKFLKYLKYAILAAFVIILPMVIVDAFGQGSPWFCTYICPAGTLEAGIPLVASAPQLAAGIGWTFWLKIGILAFLLLLSLAVYRPFCRYICPLGAIYGLFNPIALTRYKVDANKCVNCGKCAAACKWGIDTSAHPNSPDCIRCGDCKRACPTGAISYALKPKGKRKNP